MVCSACGQTGHNKANRNCPKYTGSPSTPAPPSPASPDPYAVQALAAALAQQFALNAPSPTYNNNSAGGYSGGPGAVQLAMANQNKQSAAQAMNAANAQAGAAANESELVRQKLDELERPAREAREQKEREEREKREKERKAEMERRQRESLPEKERIIREAAERRRKRREEGWVQGSSDEEEGVQGEEGAGHEAAAAGSVNDNVNAPAVPAAAPSPRILPPRKNEIKQIQRSSLRLGEVLHSTADSRIHLANFGTKKVAVKEFCGVSSGTFTERNANSFREEAERSLAFTHPHVARYYGFSIGNEASPFAALVMDLYKTGSVRDFHRRGERFAFDQALVVVDGVARALEHVHGHRSGYAHGNLTDGDILLTEDLKPVITDFGVTHKTTLSMSSRSAETPEELAALAYRPPEVLKPSQDPTTGNAWPQGIESKADVYSLGILCWRLAHPKAVPFPGCKWLGELSRRVAMEKERPAFDRSLIEQEKRWALLEQIFKCCTAHNPTERPDAVHVLAMIKESAK